MNIPSSFQKDIRCQKSAPGAYEWWYFDAISEDGNTAIVVIFYEGNPFSRRYINALQSGEMNQAAQFPAVSISVYQHEQPVFYSFTEAKKEDALFKDTRPFVQIENHVMEVRQETDGLAYQLTLDETLASGDKIEAGLCFKGTLREQDNGLIPSYSRGQHRWHVSQPRAEVDGTIDFKPAKGAEQYINFKGHGYHDHNVGLEPMKNKFAHWYWGCFHFEKATLIYYLMNDDSAQNGGWLIPNEASATVRVFSEIVKKDSARNIFGLQSARKIVLKNDDAEVMIQQRALLDNGPFYQRFISDAFLKEASTGSLFKSCGITEYLCPPRIHKRFFWPLTNMRIRYKQERPHWVQRSPRLYRWTW